MIVSEIDVGIESDVGNFVTRPVAVTYLV